MAPGATTFARRPALAYSTASWRVSCVTAALVVP
jgi:hypothetical protein